MKLGPRHNPGQSAVEFALALPMLLMMMLALVDFGLLLYAHVQVANATREGARAGSLYLGGRFHYTSCRSNCPPNYGFDISDPPCWSAAAWVENALVERVRNSNGCPTTAFDTTIHSFGLLSPAKCASATSGTNCWWLEPFAEPVAGEALTIRVTYRFSVPFFGDLVPFVQNPTPITKTVIMKVQDN
ncbi:MAG: pilus assembly protein [Chloroflexota bacterium]|nr:pilus assembly protein [Chloroflexota bacterium]